MLKTLWSDIQKLWKKATGLGRSADGGINATDKWWEENTQVLCVVHTLDYLMLHDILLSYFFGLTNFGCSNFGLQGKPDLLKLKDGMSEYLPELEKMFLGIAVTGEGSYVPGRRSKEPQYVSSDEDEDADRQTPVSTGSKRSFSSLSTHSTGMSPSKKSKSPAVRSMDNHMRHLNDILENRTRAYENIWADRQKKEDEKENAAKARRKRVLQMARDVGATEQERRLWIGVLRLTRSENDMDIFEESDADGRRVIIEYLAGVGN